MRSMGSLQRPQRRPGTPMRHGLAGLAVLVASAVVLAAAAPAGAQQPSRKPAAAEAGRGLVGLPLFSSDGKRIGRIVATGTTDNNEAVLLAQIERTLGLGTGAVAIPYAMLVRKPGRAELTITAAEVEARIAKARRDP